MHEWTYIEYIYIKYIYIYMNEHMAASQNKRVTLQSTGAKYHVVNLDTSYVFILILSYVSICKTSEVLTMS